MEEKPEKISRKHPGKGEIFSGKLERRIHRQVSVYLSPEEDAAWNDICEYWAASKAEAFRTMIRYFDVNLGLASKRNRRHKRM